LPIATGGRADPHRALRAQLDGPVGLGLGQRAAQGQLHRPPQAVIERAAKSEKAMANDFGLQIAVQQK
jgi:hypothetical protein